MKGISERRRDANIEAHRRMCAADPILVSISPAIEALPGMTRTKILTSGHKMPWKHYTGGQRQAILGGAMFEGLAIDAQEAEAKIDRGEIQVEPCHEYGCVGSLAGIYTASMPILTVQNGAQGAYGRCNFYEGTNPRRLNYGVYDEGVKERLLYVQDVVAPVVRDAVLSSGGIRLKPIMQRALHMGDELHSRNTAASLLFARELFPHLLRVAETGRNQVEKAIQALTEDNYFFLRLSMAAAKCMADAAHDIEYSSVVSAMGFSCRDFSVRISGLGKEWFSGPHPTVEAKLFPGHASDEISWMGGESIITETVGLGGFAQAAAFSLQSYQGGSPETMVDNNLAMYQIVVGDHTDFKIPYLRYRGTPTAIDIFKVVNTGKTPIMDIGIAGRDGGQIGAGLVRAHIGCFQKAVDGYERRYGRAV